MPYTTFDNISFMVRQELEKILLLKVSIINQNVWESHLSK
jgi:hypothetical protein